MSDKWIEGYELVSTARVRTVFEGRKPDGVLTEEGRYRTVDNRTGEEYVIQSRRQALAVSILIEEYDIDPRDHSSDCVPIEIATDGSPAIATYLLGALSYNQNQVSDVMSISEQTVSKYINRMRE